MYSKDSKHYRIIKRKLVIFVGSSNVANRVLDNVEFKDLLRALDPGYPSTGTGESSQGNGRSVKCLSSLRLRYRPSAKCQHGQLVL